MQRHVLHALMGEICGVVYYCTLHSSGINKSMGIKEIFKMHACQYATEVTNIQL